MLKLFASRMRIALSLILVILIVLGQEVQAGTLQDLQRLKWAYPDAIQSISTKSLVWRDGTVMAVQDNKPHKTKQERLDSPSLLDSLKGIVYQKGVPKDTASFNPSSDAGRIRYLPFFLKMYGDSEELVRKKCRTIYWMPLYFGNKYPLEVTTVNGVDKQLMQVSKELEIFAVSHPWSLPFLDAPSGTFKWRLIANTNRLSLHSFGMTIDINSNLSNYWQWDLEKAGRPITEEEALTYRNDIPWEIVRIFEDHGFIWGGKWQHYDTMHFEYRPELLVKERMQA